ncbi:hypothetical protein MA16_Dca027364 [Dendrobium catenatum]|uniref:Uncharacterized protein n=1 Tax=Dendrobium catenatum TaxID=906689 RepID=A0A2I0VPB6_9ASPA|nr:hypothetical protein MA16_Dca027364 [Dendrobium catenatum]
MRWSGGGEGFKRWSGRAMRSRGGPAEVRTSSGGPAEQLDEYIRRRRLSIFRHVDDGVRNEASKCIPPPPPPRNKWSATASSGGYRHP